jgi:hypothetical protein
MRPDDGVLHNETDRGGAFGKDAEYNRERSLSDDDDSTNDHFTQAGVKRIEAVSKSWTTLSLIIAYVAYVLCYAQNLEMIH